MTHGVAVLDAVDASPFLRRLRTPDLDALLDVATMRTVASGETFVAQEGVWDRLAVVLTGIVKQTAVDHDGHQTILRLCGAGDLVGVPTVLDGRPSPSSSTAVSDTSMLVLDGRVFRSLVRSRASIATALAATLSRDLRAAWEFQALRAHGTVTHVVLHRLLELTDRFGVVTSGGAIDLAVPLTQDELASWAGVSRETATRVLHDLRRADIVGTARRRIRILDLVSLRSLHASATSVAGAPRGEAVADQRNGRVGRRS